MYPVRTQTTDPLDWIFFKNNWACQMSMFSYLLDCSTFLHHKGRGGQSTLCQSKWATLVVADVAGARILGQPGLGLAFLDGVMSVRALLSG